MHAELNFWSDAFLINLLVQATEQKLWFYIRARGAKYCPVCFHVILLLVCKGAGGWLSWGVMLLQAPAGATEVPWPTPCSMSPWWDSPCHSQTGLWPGNPLAWAGSRLGGFGSGRGERAAQGCGWHFMLMARSLFIPLGFITIALFGTGSFSLMNPSIGFFLSWPN